MQYSYFKKALLFISILLVIRVSVFALTNFQNQKKETTIQDKKTEESKEPKNKIIGYSVEKRAIESYVFGNGEKTILFVGGIHGGYEWNSVLLAYQFIDYLNLYPEIIPKNVSVSVIPSANPDGVFKVVGKDGRFVATDIKIKDNSDGLGRFNSRGVDLNRNFDCKWKPESFWRNKKVSAGTEVFSEPETKTIRDFIKQINPRVVVFWHSQANAVYASECEKGILPETLKFMNEYSKASGYKAVQVFDSYQVTGDAEGWLASIGIPAITVEMSTHENIEWEKNLAGIKAVISLLELL